MDSKNILQMPTSKAILHLAIPLIISQLLGTLYELTDTYFVGKISHESLAAVSISGTILFFVAAFISGLSTGQLSIISRNMGKKEFEAASESAMQGLSIGFFMSIFLGVVGYCTSDRMLVALGAEGRVLSEGTDYLQILFLGTHAMFFLVLGNVIFQASGNTRTPLLVNICSLTLNILLDWILIFGKFGLPAMGVQGAAWATVISRSFGAVVLLFLLADGKRQVHLKWAHVFPNFSIIKEMWRIGFPSSLQILVRSTSATIIMKIVADFGAATIAAYGIGIRLFSIFLLPGFGLAGAACTLVGQNLGAKRIKEAERSMFLASLYYFFLLFTLALFLFPFSSFWVSLFNQNEEVVTLGGTYLRYLTVAGLFLPIGVIYSRGLQTAGDAITPLLATILALYIIQLPLAMLLPKHFMQDGIWMARGIGISLHSFLAYVVFRLGRWKKRHLESARS